MNILNTLRTINSVAVEEIQQYLAEKVESVKSIDSIEMSLNPIKVAIELRATQKAYKKLKEILIEVASYSPDGIKPKDPRDSYHV